MTKFRKALVAVVVALAAVSARGEDANEAFSRFISTFWSARAGQFYRFSDHHSLRGRGEYADYWWQAQMWETAIHHAGLTGRPADRRLVREIESGFKRSHPHWRLPSGAKNLYNDDLGWWAVACLHAYEVTHDGACLADARGLYRTIVRSQLPDGAVTWRHRSSDDGPDLGSERNVATNSLFIQLAAGLYRHDERARDRREYLSRALRCDAWLERNLVSGATVWDGIDPQGRLHRWQFTYDYGGVVASNLALYEAIGAGPHLGGAIMIADVAIQKVRTGRLRDEDSGTDTDGTGFFDILCRDLRLLAARTGRAEILGFLDARARQVAALPVPGRVFRANSLVDERLARLR